MNTIKKQPPFIEPYAPVMYTAEEFKIKMNEVQFHPLFLFFKEHCFSTYHASPEGSYIVFVGTEDEISATRWYFLPRGLFRENQDKVSKDGKKLAWEAYEKVLLPLAKQLTTDDQMKSIEIQFKFLILRTFFLKPWDSYLKEKGMDRFNYELFKAYANVTELYEPYYWSWE